MCLSICLFYLGCELILICVRKYYLPSVLSVVTAMPSIRYSSEASFGTVFGSLEASVLVSRFDSNCLPEIIVCIRWQTHAAHGKTSFSRSNSRYHFNILYC